MVTNEEQADQGLGGVAETGLADDLHERLIEQDQGTEERKKGAGSRLCSCSHRAVRCVSVLSLVCNIALLFALWLYIHSTDTSNTPLPPPPSNETDFTCPYPEIDLSDDRKTPGAASTGVSTSWASLCWRDFRTADREVGAGYRVVVSDPWQNGENVTLYTGKALTFNATDLLPDTNYTFRVESTLDSTAVANVTMKTHPVGFCGNSADVKAVIKHRDELADLVADCVLKHMLSDDAATQCIMKGSELSSDCTSCYLGEAKCSGKNCAAKCLHSRWSDSCQMCNRKYCSLRNFECSGMPYWAGATIKNHPGLLAN